MSMFTLSRQVRQTQVGEAEGDGPDQAARRGAAVKLNGGLKGRRGGNSARGRRSRATRIRWPYTIPLALRVSREVE